MIDTSRPPAPRTGFYFHHESTGLNAISPAWNQRTIFKPIGVHVPDLDPHDAYNWYHTLPDAVRSAGARRRVNFCNRPRDFDACEIEPTPYELLRQCAWAMSRDQRPDWRWMFQRDRYSRLALPTLRPTVLMQGWVYALTGRDMRKNPMTNALVVLSLGAVRSMSLLLQDDEAIEQLFDPTTPHALELYRRANEFEPADGWRVVREAERPSDEDAANGGARHLISRMLTPAPGSYIPAPTAQGHQNFRGWDPVVRRLTTRQQLRLLATAYPSELITTAFTGTRYAAMLPKQLIETPQSITSGGGSGGGEGAGEGHAA